MENFQYRLLKALLVFSEDYSLFRNHSFRIFGTLRVIKRNLVYKKKIGASGLAQQLARLMYLNNEKTYTRKFKEFLLGIWLYHRHGAEWIVEEYIKCADLGLSTKGFPAAANFYYKKSLEKLSIYELLTLVAILPNPPKNRPDVFPEDALAARNKLIHRLYTMDFVTKEDVWQANVLGHGWNKERELSIANRLIAVYEGCRREHKTYEAFTSYKPYDLPLVDKLIQWNKRRLDLTREYAALHYDRPLLEAILPQAIVLCWHGYASAEVCFTAFDSVENKKLPFGNLNISCHFMVDKDGTIYRLMPDNGFARHTPGVDWCSIGIENIGVKAGEGVTEAQVKANVALVKSLRMKYTKIKYVIDQSQQELLEQTGLYQERVQGYRLGKMVPPDKFMAELKAGLENCGVEFLG